MKSLVLLAAFALGLAALPVSGVSLELGATGSAGLSLSYGPYLDSWASVLAELGASSLTAPGSSQPLPFATGSAGVYTQVSFLDWLALRVEARVSSAGAARMALTSAGAAFDRYGVYFTGITVPALLRVGVSLGPGYLAASAGPFLGIVAGSITIVDKYASSSTTALIAPGSAGNLFYGISGSIGYSLAIGPGIAGFELRTDWARTPAASIPLGGGIYPVAVDAAFSYGFRLGGGAP